MASPGVMSSTNAVLASSHAVAAGSISFTSGSLVGSRRAYVRVTAGLPKARRSWSVLDEVLVRARRRRAALALVLRPGLAAAVGMFGGAGQPQQAQLTDLHARPQGDRQVGDVGQLEGDVT